MIGSASSPTSVRSSHADSSFRSSVYSSVSSSFWASRREATLNWLALGLLLAAWNASDNEDAATGSRRPEVLRGYAHVSVRAAQRAVSLERGVSRQVGVTQM